MVKQIVCCLLGGIFALGTGVQMAEGAGIHRRSIYSIYDTWQAPYHNSTDQAQRILVLSKGAWSFGENDQATVAGTPWTSELRSRADTLLLSDCAPFSLIGKIELNDGENTFICVADEDGFNLAAGAKLSFAINEFTGEHKDNSGLLRLEVLVSDRAR